MPGFMGMRGLDPKNPHDMDRERKEGHRASGRFDAERRSMEKVQEILRDQAGDMTAYNGGIKGDTTADCGIIAAYKVEKIMSAKIAALSFDDSLLTVQGIFSSVKFRHLPVVDEEGRIIGIISDRDLLRVVSPFFGTVNEQNRDREIMARKVGTIMTRSPLCANIDTTVQEAVRLMNSKKISCLPIVERGGTKLLGIVTWKDVVRAYCPGGFNPDRESSRLKSGVKVNPQTTESARLKAKIAEVRDRSIGRNDADLGPAAEPQAHADLSLSGGRLSLKAPQVGQQEKLRGSTAGIAGSGLAAAQRERMREKSATADGAAPSDGATEDKGEADDA